MKLIGFIKEYNDIEGASDLDSLISSQSESNVDVVDIISYLNEGYLLLAWMGYLTDVRSRELIAPDAYYTDGTWVWPAYLPYYLNKYPFIKLDSEFLTHIEKRNFKLELDSNFNENKSKYESELLRKLNGRMR